MRRRKYKLGPTKKFPVQIFASLSRVYISSERRLPQGVDSYDHTGTERRKELVGTPRPDPSERGATARGGAFGAGSRPPPRWFRA